MRLPDSAHTSRPWRIHDIAPDFRLEDVWALPTPGSPDDFHGLVRLFASFEPNASASRTLRALAAARLRIGELLGWDRAVAGIGGRVQTLRARLPDDLLDAPSGPRPTEVPATPVYLTQDEWALELANETVHGVLHLGWVAAGGDRYRGQLAVLVKPNGWLGRAYMAAITPFRHLFVYPALMRDVERQWRATAHGAALPSE
jgi:hypothetical protein